MRRLISSLLIALLLAGCASAARPPPSPVVAAPAAPVDIERGLRLAQRECARCHAIGETGDSAQAMAPPFRRLPGSSVALERLLLRTSEAGHGEMRPAGLEAADIRDLAAYIEQLD